MKLKGIFALLALSVVVKGTWWAAAVQPVILSLGAVFTALNHDVLDINPIEWQSFKPFINKQAKNKRKERERRPKRAKRKPDEKPDRPVYITEEEAEKEREEFTPLTEEELKEQREEFLKERARMDKELKR